MEKVKKDVGKILEIANDVQLLAMAELTHGQNEITKFRMHIFRLLVKRCGYTVFLLEDQYSCCELINQYIHGNNERDINDLLMQLMWFWRSKDMLKLISWMKKYNKNNGNILNFHGLDVQNICKDHLFKNDSIFKYVQRLNRVNHYIDQDNWVEADGFRDKSMFNVFKRIYNPDTKYFLYAHFYHVSKQDLVGRLRRNKLYEGRMIRVNETIDWLGCRLSKFLGEKYYAIGNIFTKGGYLETIDLIQQNLESGIVTKYTMYKSSKIYIIVDSIPIIDFCEENQLHEGLNIMSDSDDFDAIVKISREKPLDIIGLSCPY